MEKKRIGERGQEIAKVMKSTEGEGEIHSLFLFKMDAFPLH